MTDRSKAERALAFLVHEIRDEWDEQGVLSALRKVSQQPLVDVTAAAIFCATKRVDQRTPACIALGGEHWRALERMTGAGSVLTTPQPEPYVPPPPTQTASPETIRALRAQHPIRRTKEEPNV